MTLDLKQWSRFLEERLLKFILSNVIEELPTNGGQVVRKFLEEVKDVNLEQYKIIRCGPRIRKAKKRFNIFRFLRIFLES